MTDQNALRGYTVVVAGAGLAAAVDLHRYGARVIVVEARDRVGGRVWTRRDGFLSGQHAEAGGDLIEDGQETLCRLATDLGLTLAPILRHGFSYVWRGPGSRRLTHRQGKGVWASLREELEPWVQNYRLGDQQWDGVIAQTMACVSVSEWLDQIKANESMRALALGLRGFFLADPDDLSLLALVDQMASGSPGREKMYRIKEGNDQLAHRLAARLSEGVRLRTELLAVSQTCDAIQATIRTAGSAENRIAADYLIAALPATTLRLVAFKPALPAEQRDAITRLRYGCATRTLLQFKRRFWRRSGRPKAYGTNLPIGALWDANEEQPGREGILSLLAGGSASVETQKLIAGSGVTGMVRSLKWLGAARVPVLASRIVSWEEDPWARGGYAYFDPTYSSALRPWLARPHGRVFFAGEHTSQKWQGYMNGAVESGLRAAAEVRALVTGMA